MKNVYFLRFLFLLLFDFEVCWELQSDLLMNLSTVVAPRMVLYFGVATASSFGRILLRTPDLGVTAHNRRLKKINPMVKRPAPVANL